MSRAVEESRMSIREDGTHQGSIWSVGPDMVQRGPPIASHREPELDRGENGARVADEESRQYREEVKKAYMARMKAENLKATQGTHGGEDQGSTHRVDRAEQAEAEPDKQAEEQSGEAEPGRGEAAVGEEVAEAEVRAAREQEELETDNSEHICDNAGRKCRGLVGGCEKSHKRKKTAVKARPSKDKVKRAPYTKKNPTSKPRKK